MNKVGLVLSGGGAKGAYQVGVLKALAELNIEVSCVSGTSIGAINGAVVASAENTQIAYQQLKKLWLDLAEQSPLKLNSTVISGLFAWQMMSGLSFVTPAGKLLALSKHLIKPLLLNPEDGFCAQQPLNDLFDKYLSSDSLETGKPLYVGLFEKSFHSSTHVLELLASEFGIMNTKESEIIKVQNYSQEQYCNLIKASAALPIIFQAQQVGDKSYIDGGLGDWQGSKGNTPAAPLIEIEHCDYVIVSHLDHSSNWLADSRNIDSKVIELRPSKDMGGLVGGVMNFSSEKINELIEVGYKNTMESMKPFIAAVVKINLQNSARHKLKTSCLALESDGFKID